MTTYRCNECGITNDNPNTALGNKVGCRGEMLAVEPAARPAPPSPEHIGDGVYVRFDGYQLWLAANHHLVLVVALEPSVLQELVNYARRVDAAAGQKHFGV